MVAFSLLILFHNYTDHKVIVKILKNVLMYCHDLNYVMFVYYQAGHIC